MSSLLLLVAILEGKFTMLFYCSSFISRRSFFWSIETS